MCVYVCVILYVLGMCTIPKEKRWAVYYSKNKHKRMYDSDIRFKKLNMGDDEKMYDSLKSRVNRIVSKKLPQLGCKKVP